ERVEVELNVCMGARGATAQKSAGLVHTQGQRPPARERKLRGRLRLAGPGAEFVVQGSAVRPVEITGTDVILQVSTDCRGVPDHADAMIGQERRVAHAGELE